MMCERCELQTHDVLAARWDQYLCCSAREEVHRQQLTLRAATFSRQDEQRELSTDSLRRFGLA